MENTELIRQEIERQMSLWWEKLPDADKDTATWTQDEVKALGEYMAYESLLDFIDSLPKETVTDCNELKEEVVSYFQGYWPGTETAEQCNTHFHFTPLGIMRLAEHFAKWGAEHRDRFLNWIRDLIKKGIEKPEEALNILKRIDTLIDDDSLWGEHLKK